MTTHKCKFISYIFLRVPRFEGAEWKPVTPDSPELDFLEISSPDKAAMKSSSDFGHKSFWDNLGFVENERYNQFIKDEL